MAALNIGNDGKSLISNILTQLFFFLLDLNIQVSKNIKNIFTKVYFYKADIYFVEMSLPISFCGHNILLFEVIKFFNVRLFFLDQCKAQGVLELRGLLA